MAAHWASELAFQIQQQRAPYRLTVIAARLCNTDTAGRHRVTFGDGTTENVIIMRSGYSSRILLISSVPMPEPVPPPSEWQTWKPARQVP